tara:strand:+ start:927 stop:2000 length:1074 start_codon:yes stop_codon:yes gene_type:complete
MPRNIIHVVGTGTIGEPLIGILSDFKQELGIDEVTFHKNTPLTTDRSKVISLLKRGARLSTKTESFGGFREIGLKPEFTTEEAIDRATVVIDCTPSGIGHKNKVQYYEKFKNNTKGFIAQGSEAGFGKMYARGINDASLLKGKDQYIHVVSCNTHNLCCLIDTIVLDGEDENNLKEGMFTCIRRSNDVSQSRGFVPSPQVGSHKDVKYGTHHARDAAELYKTLKKDLNLFSSAIKVNSQYMHILHFHLRVVKPTNMKEVMNKLKSNDRIALTDKIDSCKVFSFGRDHGHFGRILNQTVISIPSLHISPGGTEITGFCFTPQDGNSLLSSISAALWFIYPNSYEDRIQCLKPLFFEEV